MAAASGNHGGSFTGVQVSTTLEVLGQSQVCGQCHGSFTNVAGTLGIYGYTPNQPLRNFVDVNGASGGQSYTKIPTEAEFLANPTAYWMFPNGSNAKGGHYYYDEWAASAHSYRGAYYKAAVKDAAGKQIGPLPTDFSPDAMTFQTGRGTPTDPAGDPPTGSWGQGHFNATAQSSIDSKCYNCHTGEGYLSSKDAKIAEGFVATTSTIGKMGQECATCHQGHPSAIGAEDVVREPDKAGERSAKGLTADNASICEDCHNWQFEVQNTAPAYKPLASLTSRGGPSHPQRETYHGRVMLDVPDRRPVHARRQVRRLPHAQDQQGRQPHLPRHEAHAAG